MLAYELASLPRSDDSEHFFTFSDRVDLLFRSCCSCPFRIALTSCSGARRAIGPPSPPMQFSSPWSTHRIPSFQEARRCSSLHELQMHESDCTESAPTTRPRFSKTVWLKRKFLASAALLSVAFSWSPQPSRASCFAPIISGETAVMDVATGLLISAHSKGRRIPHVA